eukprot:m.71596 g.71596  ORF g.71596 m.71596 type:complete len:342 (+) comp12263_c0_seq2:67-1092(+)
MLWTALIGALLGAAYHMNVKDDGQMISDFGMELSRQTRGKGVVNDFMAPYLDEYMGYNYMKRPQRLSSVSDFQLWKYATSKVMSKKGRLASDEQTWLGIFGTWVPFPWPCKEKMEPVYKYLAKFEKEMLKLGKYQNAANILTAVVVVMFVLWCMLSLLDSEAWAWRNLTISDGTRFSRPFSTVLASYCFPPQAVILMVTTTILMRSACNLLEKVMGMDAIVFSHLFCSASAAIAYQLWSVIRPMIFKKTPSLSTYFGTTCGTIGILLLVSHYKPLVRLVFPYVGAVGALPLAGVVMLFDSILSNGSNIPAHIGSIIAALGLIYFSPHQGSSPILNYLHTIF